MTGQRSRHIGEANPTESQAITSPTATPPEMIYLKIMMIFLKKKETTLKAC